MSDTLSVINEVNAERVRQDAKWGEQNHPDGTGPDVTVWIESVTPTPNEPRRKTSHAFRAADLAEGMRARCKRAPEEGGDTYERILTEEWAEALAESDPARLREELIQVAAVAVAWVEAIDRRGSAS